MPESWLSPDIICPFFRKESKSKHNISCEGPQDGTTVNLNFASEAVRESWLQRHCMSWDFGRCPIGKLASEKYKEDE